MILEKKSGRRLGVGVYGNNGHQIHGRLLNHPHAELIGISAFPPDQWPKDRNLPRIYHKLEDMLQDAEIELVSLCSPRRDAQAGDAILCLRAGRHVLAEKPCALSETELDTLLDVSRQSGCTFHEMAGSAFEEPWAELARVALGGTLAVTMQLEKGSPSGSCCFCEESSTKKPHGFDSPNGDRSN